MTAIASQARTARLPATTIRDLRLVGLTFSSGAVDAIAFLGLGKVFTAFQTGNLVFLGVGAADAGGPDVLRVACSLLGFALGVLAATLLVRPTKGSGPWPRRVTLALSIAMAVQAAFLAVWATGSGSSERARFAGVFVALSAGAAAGALLLVHARVFAPALPFLATALVVATAAVQPLQAAPAPKSAV